MVKLFDLAWLQTVSVVVVKNILALVTDELFFMFTRIYLNPAGLVIFRLSGDSSNGSVLVVVTFKAPPAAAIVALPAVHPSRSPGASNFHSYAVRTVTARADVALTGPFSLISFLQAGNNKIQGSIMIRDRGAIRFWYFFIAKVWWSLLKMRARFMAAFCYTFSSKYSL